MPSQAKLDDAVTGQSSDYVLVPRKPTPEMIEAAYWSAFGEDAEGVWGDMIRAYESSNSNSGAERD
jgi:hypothetical protein